MTKPIDWDLDDKKIATLRMQDTENKNVFSHAFVEAFLATFDEIEEAEPRVLVIRGLDDVFSGGADRESLMELAAGKIVVRDLVLSERLIHARFPIIAAMEGHAMGGGLVIGLCSDIVLMANESRYGAVFINMGFTPGMGTTTLLPLLVGPYLASEMMMTGRRYRGKELKGLGVHVNDILPKAEVLPKARDLALQIAEKNPKSIALLKAALSTPKKKLLIDARAQEDLMHHLSFGFPETKAIIHEFYAGK
ncbi:MAG: enoyl-CoA hydratase/isomerase family protein [Spirochaetes bacterium]|nr:enoyl-CoA hydratase/isomerase family protein [Spirochaetota bacterium]